MDYAEGIERVNTWLRERKVPHGIGELTNNKTLHPECGPVLLELFNSSVALPVGVRIGIAGALFDRKLNASQKKDAVEAFLNFIKQNAGCEISWLSVVVLNGFARNIDASKVHEIGMMALDRRYSTLRPEFAHVLYRIGNADAISYLLKAAQDPITAALALDGLARLRVHGTLELCEEALGRKDVQGKDAIKETLSKLKRQLAKKRAALLHDTTDPIPKELEEWSTNLDGSDLPKVLRGIQRCVESGFGKPETSEVRSAADTLSPEQTVRLKFAVKCQGKETDLWLEIFCDDENAFDVYAFSSRELVSRIEKTMERILE